MLGLLRTTAGAVGAIFGSMLDDRLGSGTSLQVAVAMICLCFFVMLSCTDNSVLFLIHTPDPQEVWLLPYFDTVPEIVFVASSLGLSFCVIATATSCRALVVKLTPPEQTVSYFGLYARAGTATAWLAPGLIDIFTRLFDSQRAGLEPLLGVVALGLIAFMFIRGGNERAG